MYHQTMCHMTNGLCLLVVTQIAQLSQKSSLDAGLHKDKAAEEHAYEAEALNARPPWQETGALPPGIILSPKVSGDVHS